MWWPSRFSICSPPRSPVYSARRLTSLRPLDTASATRSNSLRSRLLTPDPGLLSLRSVLSALSRVKADAAHPYLLAGCSGPASAARVATRAWAAKRTCCSVKSAEVFIARASASAEAGAPAAQRPAHPNALPGMSAGPARQDRAGPGRQW